MSLYSENILLLLLLLLLLLKQVGSARLRVSDIHLISPITPAPQYQPIERTKRKGNIAESIVGIEQLMPKKKALATIEYGVSKIIPEGQRQRNKSPAILRRSAARQRISIPMCDQGTTCNPHEHIRTW